jgi:hypothetical protein
MNRCQKSVLGLVTALGLVLLSACASGGATTPLRTASGAPLSECRDERAACQSDAECCNANCFYGECERPEQE